MATLSITSGDAGIYNTDNLSNHVVYPVHPYIRSFLAANPTKQVEVTTSDGSDPLVSMSRFNLSCVGSNVIIDITNA